MNIHAKPLNKILTNQIQQYLKGLYTMTKVRFILGNARIVQHKTSRYHQCNKPDEQKEEKKPHDYFNKHKQKSI